MPCHTIQFYGSTKGYVVVINGCHHGFSFSSTRAVAEAKLWIQKAQAIAGVCCMVWGSVTDRAVVWCFKMEIMWCCCIFFIFFCFSLPISCYLYINLISLYLFVGEIFQTIIQFLNEVYFSVGLGLFTFFIFFLFRYAKKWSGCSLGVSPLWRIV